MKGDRRMKADGRMEGDGLREGVAKGDSEGSGEGDSVGLEDMLADCERDGVMLRDAVARRDHVRDGVLLRDAVTRGDHVSDGVLLRDAVTVRERFGAQQAERFRVPIPRRGPNTEKKLPLNENELTNDDSSTANQQPSILTNPETEEEISRVLFEKTQRRIINSPVSVWTTETVIGPLSKNSQNWIYGAIEQLDRIPVLPKHETIVRKTQSKNASASLMRIAEPSTAEQEVKLSLTY
jgi:hypothetical protein